MNEVIEKKKLQLNELKKSYKDSKLEEVTVSSILEGTQGLTTLICETSKVHPI